MKLQGYKLIFSILLTVLVTACGGGGGGSPAAASSSSTGGGTSSGTGGTTGGSGTTVAQDLIATGTANYVAGTVASGAYKELIRARTTCGFGSLNQNVKLDAAAFAHSKFNGQNSADSVNTFYSGHYEVATMSYFTGVGPNDRDTYQGYSYQGFAENQDDSYTVYTSSLTPPFTIDEPNGAWHMRNFLFSVYHLTGTMEEGRDVGIGGYNVIWNVSVGQNAQASNLGMHIDYQLGVATQKLGTGSVASFPCAGFTNFRPNFEPATELPNPLPSITSTTQSVGSPLFFKSDAGTVLDVTSLVLTRVSNASPTITTKITSTSDTSGHVKSNMVFYVPQNELAANETYRVQAAGTVDGTAFTKDFTFTTGAVE